jgi:hypothetical protein
MAVKHKKRGFKAKQRPGRRPNAKFLSTHSVPHFDPAALRASLIAEIPSLEVSLQSCVKELRSIICSHDPTSVISMVHDAFMLARWKAGTTYASDNKPWYLGLLLEYVHACYSCTESLQEAPYLGEAAFERLCVLMPRLLESANRLVSARAAQGLVVDGTAIAPEGVAIYAAATMHWLGVRKKRHLSLDVPLLRAMLEPQDQVLRDVFGISAEETVAGFERLLTSLRKGKSELWMEMVSLWSRFAKKGTMTKEAVEAELAGPKGARLRGLRNLDTFDVQAITGWPAKLVDELTWKRGQCTKFFDGQPDEGWPTKELPCRRRPFVEIDGKAVCFDIVALTDWFYSALQRAVRVLDPTKDDAWRLGQTQATEQLPQDLLGQLLPGVQVLHSRHFRYLDATGKTRTTEVDNIALYDNVLFIAESKGGNFTPSSPVEDFKSYKKALTKLVVEPAEQCARLIATLDQVETLQLFHDEKCSSPAETLSRSDFRLIVPIGLTLENFTVLAAQAHKLPHLGLSHPLAQFWSLALDDLMVLSRVFERPSTFLHYVEQRLEASGANDATFIDEHDHLALYLSRNHYSAYLRANGVSQVVGDTSALDQYLLGLEEGSSPPSLEQKLPTVFSAVLRALETTNSPGWTGMATSLLDLGAKGRKQFTAHVEEAASEAVRAPRPRVFWFHNGVTFVGVYAQPESVPPEPPEAVLELARQRIQAQGWSSAPLLGISVDATGAPLAAWVTTVTVWSSRTPMGW